MAVCLFLAGLLVAGFASVLRSDIIGQDAANEVKSELMSRIETIEVRHGEILFHLSELKAQVASLEAKIEMMLAKPGE